MFQQLAFASMQRSLDVMGVDKPKVLVADDDEDLQRAIRRTAEAAGCVVLQEFDGASVVATAREQRPALILLDIDMPAADGRDLLRQLKADPSTKAIPVLMFSARSDQFDRHTCLELGAEDYLEKPWPAELLMHRVRRLLEG